MYLQPGQGHLANVLLSACWVKPTPLGTGPPVGDHQLCRLGNLSVALLPANSPLASTSFFSFDRFLEVFGIADRPDVAVWFVSPRAGNNAEMVDVTERGNWDALFTAIACHGIPLADESLARPHRGICLALSFIFDTSNPLPPAPEASPDPEPQTARLPEIEYDPEPEPETQTEPAPEGDSVTDDRAHESDDSEPEDHGSGCDASDEPNPQPDHAQGPDASSIIDLTAEEGSADLPVLAAEPPNLEDLELFTDQLVISEVNKST